MMSDTASGSVVIENVEGVTDAQLETLEKLYRAIAGELDLLFEAVTPDWQDIPAPVGQEPGPQGAVEHLPHLHAAFSDRSIVLHDVIGSNGLVAVRAELNGTHTGEWFGVPASGVTVSIPAHEFHRFEGDRVAISWHMEDWLAWLLQIGADGLKTPTA
jgi:predicted ester cyclase